MKIFVAVDPPHLSQGIHRVARALKQFAPEGVHVVENKLDADVVVLHAIGYPEIVDWQQAAHDRGQQTVIVQYCLRTSQRPSTVDWLPLWQRAALVWSYYDLRRLLREDHVLEHGDVLPFNFYHAPLGVDGDIFRWKSHAGHDYRYQIGTSGYVADTEGVLECNVAQSRLTPQLQGHFHLGPPSVHDARFPTSMVCQHGMGDVDVAARWQDCQYVAGLRRVEGFELPALEGLACGARPIVFDKPHYRQWFDIHAEYVPEGSFDEVVDALEQIFRGPYRKVTQVERDVALLKFRWAKIVRQFYDRLLNA